MRACLILALAILAGSVSTAGQQRPARDILPSGIDAGGSVRGRVVADDGGLPLIRARVNLSAAGGRLRIDPIFTDASGRFEFGDLPAGQYTLAVTKTGYVWGRLGVNEVERSVQFDLAERGAIEGLDVRLRRAAAISGRVLDDLGDPVLAADVAVGTPERTNGLFRLANVRSAVTDDRGEFRISGLFAGTYVVSVSGARAGMMLAGAPEEWRRNMSWGQTYFPGTSDLSTAQRLTLKTGEEFSGADIMLRASTGTGGRLTVTVTDPQGNPAVGSVRLVGPNMEMGMRLQKGRGQTPPLPPGEWLVIAEGSDGLATGRVTVESDDVALSLALARGARMTGRIVVEGPDSVDVTRLPFSAVSISRTLLGTSPVFSNPSWKVNRDRTFEIGNMIGAVELSIRGNSGWFVKSMTLEDRNLLDSPFEFNGGEEFANVQVVISSESRAFTGVVIDAQRTPVVGCSAIVFPEDPQVLRSGRLTRWVRSDLNGRFQIAGLPPGRYFAVALTRPDPIEWSTPEYLAALRSAATHVLLSAGEKSDVTLLCREQP